MEARVGPIIVAMQGSAHRHSWASVFLPQSYYFSRFGSELMFACAPFCVYGKVVSDCIKLPERSLLASVLCAFMSKHIPSFVAFSLRYFVFSLSLWTILISAPFSCWVLMRSSDTVSMWNYPTFKCLHSWVFSRISFSHSQMFPDDNTN